MIKEKNLSPITQTPSVYLGLVHWPVINKKGMKVTTSVTNLDIHDISRTAKTFGLKKYFLIGPMKEQKDLVGRILDHWKSDKGNCYNPDRSEALSLVEIADSVEHAIEEVTKLEGVRPYIVVTGANILHDGDENTLKEKIWPDNRPILMLFGTGWGLAPEIVELGDFKMCPIKGQNQDYNHLSVRAAAAIYCDRILRALEL